MLFGPSSEHSKAFEGGAPVVDIVLQMKEGLVVCCLGLASQGCIVLQLKEGLVVWASGELSKAFECGAPVAWGLLHKDIVLQLK